MITYTFVSETERQRQADVIELEDSLIYIVNSRPASLYSKNLSQKTNKISWECKLSV